MGNVLQAGLGQNVARQVSMAAGIPKKFLPSRLTGMWFRTQAVSLAAQIVKLGDADVIVAGGTENMSAAPYLVPKQDGEHEWATHK